jgi:hypothetical protein
VRQPEEIPITRYTPLEEIEKALCRHIQAINLNALADQAALQTLDRVRGRV